MKGLVAGKTVGIIVGTILGLAAMAGSTAFVKNVFGQEAARNNDVDSLNKLGKKIQRKCDEISISPRKGGNPFSININLQRIRELNIKKITKKRANLKADFKEGEPYTYRLEGCKFEGIYYSTPAGIEPGSWVFQISYSSGINPPTIRVEASKK